MVANSGSIIEVVSLEGRTLSDVMANTLHEKMKCDASRKRVPLFIWDDFAM